MYNRLINKTVKGKTMKTNFFRPFAMCAAFSEMSENSGFAIVFTLF
jgi:hypothetical protein